jgi:hypothetical protein
MTPVRPFLTMVCAQQQSFGIAYRIMKCAVRKGL